jgi:hypothetical protein
VEKIPGQFEFAEVPESQKNAKHDFLVSGVIIQIKGRFRGIPKFTLKHDYNYIYDGIWHNKLQRS